MSGMRVIEKYGLSKRRHELFQYYVAQRPKKPYVVPGIAASARASD